MCGHIPGQNCNTFAYLPNFSQTEVCLMVVGHHALHDGMTEMQCCYAFTDQFEDPDHYPFIERPTPGFFGWIFVYLTLLYWWIGGFKHWFARKPDINCIKKHGDYHSG